MGKFVHFKCRMIHGLRIKNGKATYVSRYVKTSRLQQEEFFGSTKFLKIGDMKGFFWLTHVHLANSEADVIKILDDGDLQTLGILDYDRRLGHSFTAHPKIDPVTGREMFIFGYSQMVPCITYRVISRNGFMHDPVLIKVSEPPLMHDFAITMNYAIFMDLPITKNARFGVLPRYAMNEQQIRWFELSNCCIFHNANAWEEGDEVVLITCRIQNPMLEQLASTVEGKVENLIIELYEMRFNMKTGLASQKKLSRARIDFPKINEYYTRRKQRYVYGAVIDNVLRVNGNVKFDLQAASKTGKGKSEAGGNVKGIFEFGAGKFGSEAIFVPKEPGISSAEDDGYLICFAHDENSGKSMAMVIDARTVSVDPVAVVDLPTRVPYGFHACFVSEVSAD
ncbi:hypothetical protein SAY86_030616 [Trapa natans]|uniref:carotenoid 9,10-dioxygenase n=1 Tax=Trapa natans TaxID=22666 RepID=A0AAN7RDU0_TRANT|nr:hypothetical protein SAY86_030616 [Trapa natans]